MESMSGANGFAASVEKGLGTHDSIDLVHRCLNCAKAECSNCLAYKTKPIPDHGPLRKKIQELYFGKSMSAPEIATLLGVSRKIIDAHVRAIRRGGIITYHEKV